MVRINILLIGMLTNKTIFKNIFTYHFLKIHLKTWYKHALDINKVKAAQKTNKNILQTIFSHSA